MKNHLDDLQATRQGFSLIEVILVVTIIGILTALLIPRITSSSDTAEEKSCYHNRLELNSAIERFGVTTGTLPTAISDLNTLDYFPGGIPVCPVTGAAYTLDTIINRVNGHTNTGNH